MWYDKNIMLKHQRPTVVVMYSDKKQQWWSQRGLATLSHDGAHLWKTTQKTWEAIGGYSGKRQWVRSRRCAYDCALISTVVNNSVSTCNMHVHNHIQNNNMLFINIFIGLVMSSSSMTHARNWLTMHVSAWYVEGYVIWFLMIF